MARNLAARPLTVTGVLRADGSHVEGLVITSAQEVRDFLLAGPRLTDGVVVASGWADLICTECGDNAAWCPDLRDALPLGWGREPEPAGWQHHDGLVVMA